MMKKRLILSLMVGLCLSWASPGNALDLSAFGDVTFSDSNNGDPSGFSLGQLDFWATQKLGPEGKFKAFLELVVESPGSGFVVDLERLWVQYALLPGFDARAGRMHTSLGYWNRVHHHGAHMQTTVSRPLFLDFEDGETAVLPTHTVGVMSLINLDTSATGINIELQAGNGASHNGEEIDPNNVGDNDDSKGLAARVLFSPHALDGLGLGFSFNYNKLNQTLINNDVNGDGNLDTTPSVTEQDWVDQMIYEVDITFVDKLETGIEFIAEYYVVDNEDPAGKSYSTSFWYVQAGKTLFDFATPYVRYESFEDVDAGDPYFKTLGTTEYSLGLVGVRFDFNLTQGAETALKVEVGFKDEPEALGGSSESYAVQWTFGF